MERSTYQFGDEAFVDMFGFMAVLTFVTFMGFVNFADKMNTQLYRSKGEK